MTLTFPYRFAIALFGEDGTELGTIAVKRDWEPAAEWTRLRFQRRGELALDANGSASVLPLWEELLGEPYCCGYRVQITQPGGQAVASDFPITDFRDFANATASAFVEQKRLREGEVYTYMVVAHPTAPEAPDAGGLQVTNASPRIPAGDASLDSFLVRATPHGAPDVLDIPVFVSSQVLEEAAAQTRACQGTETGGVLIGSLWRDRTAGEIFAEVKAQIPAEHAAGTKVRLTFTPTTWTAAEAALRLRGRGEIYLGYWHSHPVREWCKTRTCTLEAQKVCRFAKDFFSADDEAVMRAAFPRAYCVAIVANDTAFTDLTFSMFGNHQGMIRPRGFYILEEQRNVA